jgi:GT2 family glycosyltransferase
LRKGLEQIQDEYVLFFLDDMLIREPVNKDLINNAFQVLQKNDKIAVVNFEHNYREALPFSDY